MYRLSFLQQVTRAVDWDSDLLEYVHDDLVHYSGEFHSRNVAGFHVNPDGYQLWRDIATALRSGLSLSEAKQNMNCEGV